MLVKYLRDYQEGGIERLKELHYQGQPSLLNEHIPSLKAHFKSIPRTMRRKLKRRLSA